MDSGVHIRKLIIGAGRAKICVPVVGKTKEEIISQAEKVVAMEPDLIEWRCDFYESMYIEDVEERLMELREIIGDKPLIFTFRTNKEGGEKFISNDNYYDLNVAVAKSGMADLIDVEAYSKQNIAEQMISEIHDAGCKVIASNHDFDSTPEAEEIEKKLMLMEEHGPDICKIAVMPQEKKDVDKLIQASVSAREKMLIPIVTMSMGELGAVTRVCTKLTGSAITFAAGTSASAPGQMSPDMVREILEYSENLTMDKNLMLIGFMGTGKTTVSSALSKITGLEEVDMDKYIVEKEGMSIPEIFDKFGEAGFREKETEALKEIQQTKGKLVSCGGGVVLKDENVEIMKDGGVILLLTASPEVIFDRVKDNTDRPILNADMSLEHVKKLMDARRERYEYAADITINTDHSDRVRTCYDILRNISAL